MDDVGPYIMWFYTEIPIRKFWLNWVNYTGLNLFEIQTHSGTTINEWINYYRSKNNAKKSSYLR